MANEPIPAAKKSKPRCVRTVVNLPGERKISVYAGRRVTSALTEISRDMSLYHGVRLAQVLEAVYEQGMKDGTRSLFDKVDDLKRTVAYRNPGAPTKKKRPALRRRKKK